jgi:hypothetical protein
LMDAPIDTQSPWLKRFWNVVRRLVGRSERCGRARRSN